MARLGDCFSVIRNGVSIKQIDGAAGLPITRIETISNRVIDRNKFGYADIYDISKYEDYLLHDQDILMSHINSEKHLGKVAIYHRKENEQVIHGMNLLMLRANQDMLYPQYAAYYFESPFFKRQIVNITKKSVNQASFTVSALKKLEISISSLDEQRKIAAVLDEVSDLIAKRRQQLDKLDELVKSRFIEMFGDGKYAKVKASDVCDFITKGTTPSSGDIFKDYAEDRVPFLRVYNLSFTGELLFDVEPQYIPKDIHDGKLVRSKVFPNDILMNIVGPPLGKFSLVTDEFNEWNINQAIAIFRAKERVLPRFLMYALMQPEVLHPFLEQAVGIRQLNLSLEQCRNLEFPLPPIEEQKMFVEFAEQINKSKLAIQKSLEKLEIMKSALMQQYFG